MIFILCFQASLRITMLDWLKEKIINEIRKQFQYRQTSVIEQFCSRPSRFSTKKFEIFTSQTSTINSGHDQTEGSRANTNAPLCCIRRHSKSKFVRSRCFRCYLTDYFYSFAWCISSYTWLQRKLAEVVKLPWLKCSYLRSFSSFFFVDFYGFLEMCGVCGTVEGVVLSTADTFSSIHSCSKWWLLYRLTQHKERVTHRWAQVR